MSEIPTPKFKVGQIVVVKSAKRQPVFRILATHFAGEWTYAWNRNNYACEHMLRALTAEEKGEA